MRYGNSTATFLWIVGLAAILLGTRLPAAFAQADSLADWTAKDKAGGFNEPIKPQRVTFSGLGAALRTGQFDNPAAAQQFADVYEQRVFPGVTNPKTRGEKEDVVAAIRSHFKQVPAGSEVHDKLAEITLAYMSKIAADPKWHPAVRVYAILVIGEVKSPEAVTMLLGMVRNPQLNRAFKVAAMSGLVHLAELGVVAADPQVAGQVAGVMIAAVRANTKPQSDGLRWMRGQAADVLGVLAGTGDANAVPLALIVMLGDDELTPIQRGKAARALGKLSYQGDPPNAAAYFSALVGFGSDALAATLPADARRVRTVARDFLEGLRPLLKQASVPRAVHDVKDAMDKLQKEASKTPAPAEEELKKAIAAAKAATDAAGGMK